MAEGLGLEELYAQDWSLVGIKMGIKMGEASGLVEPDDPDAEAVVESWALGLVRLCGRLTPRGGHVCAEAVPGNCTAAAAFADALELGACPPPPPHGGGDFCVACPTYASSIMSAGKGQ